MSSGPTGPAKVFISYRREETAAHAGRLYDAMVARFEDANVFMDVDMKPGVDFVDEITNAVAACHVLIVVMGPRWATVQDDQGRPRIADPKDFVRLEVETGLRRPDVTPIPVLVSGARMPEPETLPPEVRAITRRQALELSDHGWRYDVGRLISTLDELLAERVHDAPEGSVDTQQVAPPGPKLPSRRRLWAGVGAAVVLAALAALAFALLRDGSDDPPDRSEGQWTRVEAGASFEGSGQQEILDLANLPGGRAIAVGKSGATAAVWMFDGSSWSASDLGEERGAMWDVVLAGDTLLAAGSREFDAAFWLSSDGGPWEPAVCEGCGGEGQQIAFGIARGKGSIVAVGRAISGDRSYDAAVWRTSNGGRHWARAAEDSVLAGPKDQVMKAVVELDGRLVAVGRDGADAAVWRSIGGEKWERQAEDDPELAASTGFLEMNAITTLGTRIVVVGSEKQGKFAAAAWISPDGGSTWRRGRGDFTPRGQEMRDVAAVGPELVAVGFDEEKSAAAVWRSEDGETWTRISSSAFAGDVVEMNGVARMANGTLFGGGSESEDAALWESSAP